MKQILILASFALLLSSCLRPVDMGQLADRYPDLRSSDRVRFITFGDMGDGKKDQYSVARAMHSICQERGCDFALTLGDNVYPNGIQSVDDPQAIEKFEKPYEIFGAFPFWMTIGNHDWKGLLKSSQAAIDYTLHSTRWLQPYIFYQIPALPSWLHISIIDTSLIESGVGSPSLLNARDAFCKKSGWKVLAGHYPLWSNRKKDRTNGFVRKAVETVIRNCNVSVYLAGHDHHQEHIDKGFYQHIIQGAGGAGLNEVNVVGGEQKFASSEHGFAYISVTKELLQIDFYNNQSAKIYSLSLTQN